MALRIVTIFALLISSALCAQQNVSLRERYSLSQSQWPKAQVADEHAPKPLAPLVPKLALPDPKLVELGKALFNDPILSRNNTVSCSSCHDANQFFQDSMGQAKGIDGLVGTRNTPPIFGIDHWNSFFWDGRATTSTEQALMPIANPIEMDLPIAEAITRLNESETYPTAFLNTMGKSHITEAMLAMALVAFERTIPAPKTRYQAFIAKAQYDPKQAVTLFNDSELEGFHLFRTKAKCMTCHEGPLLSDNAFHVTGFHLYGRRFEDLGRVHATKNTNDIGKFRTPSLLGVTHTAPWMHNGLFVEFTPMIMQYNAGGFRPKPRGKYKNDPHFPVTSDLIVPLGLSKAEVSALVDFLHTL